MKKYVNLAVVFVALLVGPRGWGQTPSNEPTLSVQGAGVVRVAPDIATVRLGISVEGDSASSVQAQANAVASAILDAVQSEGIAERQVQTARLQLFPIYARQVPGENNTPRIIGYRASNTVTIRVESLSEVGDVIDAGLEAGANQLEGVGFGLDDDREAREDALRQAVGEARSKAEVMADALDVDLDGILSISEGGVFIQQPVMPVMEARLAAQADSSTPVAPGEVEVRANVSIQYRIAQ
jgi:uncharacterized protein YggE